MPTKSKIRTFLIGSAMAITCSSLLPPALAFAEEDERLPSPRGPAWTIVPEGRIQYEYSTNSLQLSGSGADSIGKLFVGTGFNYDFARDELGIGSSTQLTGQYQLQVWRYAQQPIYNVALNIFTLILGEKFHTPGFKLMDTITPYIGGQLVHKLPTSSGVNRLDGNFLAGFNALKIFGRDRYLAGGYQFSNLLAEVPQTAYSAHTLNVLYRMGLLPGSIDLIASYQLQLRVPQDRTVEKNLRNTVGVSFQFTIYPGFTATLGGDYTNQYAAPIAARLDYYTVNVSLGSNMFLNLP